MDRILKCRRAAAQTQLQIFENRCKDEAKRAEAAEKSSHLVKEQMRDLQNFETRCKEEARRAEVAETNAQFVREQLKEMQGRANQLDFELQRERTKSQNMERDMERAKKDAELSKLDMRVVMEGESLLKARIRALEDEVDARDGKDRQVSASPACMHARMHGVNVIVL
jgi:hypothetical protein